MEKNKILIVEDEKLLRELYEMVVQSMDMTPILYENGPDFMNDYKNHINKTVMGIFDNDFPGPYKGTDLIKEVTDKYGLYSILISGTATPKELEKEALQKGAKKFLEKPFDLKILKEEIKKGIESKL